MENTALEVASRHWRASTDDAWRKLRNRLEREKSTLAREKSVLASRLGASRAGERRLRRLVGQLQQYLLSIRRTLRILAERSF